MAIVDPHYLWAFGHLVMLSGSIYILIQSALFRPTPSRVYKGSYTGALLSYSIVVVKSLGYPTANRQWIARAFADENVQYAILALYWWISKPINITVLPFMTFSLFHCLTFLRTNILPKLSSAPAAAPGQPRPPRPTDAYSRKIQDWVKSNYDTAMRFVAYAELAIFLRVAVGALLLRDSLITPLFLAHFLRLRYHASPFTKQAITTIKARLDDIFLPRGGMVANVYRTGTGMLEKWGGGRLVPPAGPAAGAGAGAPPAAAPQAARPGAGTGTGGTDTTQ